MLELSESGLLESWLELLLVSELELLELLPLSNELPVLSSELEPEVVPLGEVAPPLLLVPLGLLL